MSDVLPIVVVGVDENLAVELIGRHVERSHIRGKLEQCRETIGAEETKASGEGSRRNVFVSAGKDEAPFAEGGDVDVVRKGLQAGLF